jgi:hypothetical protein
MHKPPPYVSGMSSFFFDLEPPSIDACSNVEALISFFDKESETERPKTATVVASKARRDDSWRNFSYSQP